MKLKVLAALFALFVVSALPAAAQFVNDMPRAGDWTGSIIKEDSKQRTLLGTKIGFSMNHSYEMSFVSFGGQGYNQNMYTNTMLFGFSDRLNGRVDLALAHSPFGNGLMTQGNQVQFLVRNAELNYRVGKNSHVSLQFSQMPYGYGYGFGPGNWGYRNGGAWGNRFNSPFYPY